MINAGSAVWWSACPVSAHSCQRAVGPSYWSIIFGVAVHYSIMLGLAAVSF